MIPDHQIRFIEKIRSALKKTEDTTTNAVGAADPCSQQPDEATRRLLHAIYHRTDAGRDKLMQMLLEAANPINLNVLPCKDAGTVATHIRGLAIEKNPEWDLPRRIITWRHPLIQALDLPHALSKDNIPVFEADPVRFNRPLIRQNAIEAYIGVTSADFCMADTATLVMKSRPGQIRSVSLLPTIHIAVIHQEQIIADMKELFALLQWDEKERMEGLTNCMTFISGPSKTADIEATMVHGAHGPREVYLYVITGIDSSAQT